MPLLKILSACLARAGVLGVAAVGMFAVPHVGAQTAAQPAPSSAHSAAAVPPTAEAVLLQMQQAFARGDSAQLSALLPLTLGHPLHGWAAYWELAARLKTATHDEVEAFLQRFSNTYVQDRLRNDWLLLLGQRRQWAEFERHWAAFRMRDDRQAQCYATAVQAIESRADAAAADRVLQAWLAAPNNDDGCAHAAAVLHGQGLIAADAPWQRARRAAHQGMHNAMRQALTLVAPEHVAAVQGLIAAPEKFLNPSAGRTGKSKKSSPIAAPQIDPRMAALALSRLAATAPERAHTLMQQRWAAVLAPVDADWVWGAIGQAAAQQRKPLATTAFARVRHGAHLSADMLEWKVRAYLRSGQWAHVRTAIESMSEAQRAQPVWTYWLARSLQTAPRKNNRAADERWARELLSRVATHTGDFYGQLALDDLGQRLVPPAEPAAPTAAELAAAAANPGLQRALQAITIGLRREGVREWNYTTSLHTAGGMDDRSLLAAAALACRLQVWDRCINTSERTRSFASWSQRYPTPLIDAVRPRAQERALDVAYVYGLVRQESRFITDARSHVGATGLMQIMPATARWTAKKIGLKPFDVSMLEQQSVNLTLGTAYLKLVLDDFEGSMALAAAGYNAGPSRPRTWRNGPRLDAAIWAENIPFSETRDYVKKVLANTTAYAALLEGQPQSLRQRLGATIGPRPAQARTPSADLP